VLFRFELDCFELFLEDRELFFEDRELFLEVLSKLSTSPSIVFVSL